MPEIPQFISTDQTPVGIAPTLNPQGALAAQHELNRAENALMGEAAYQNRVNAHLRAVQDTAVRNSIVESTKLKFQNDLAQLEQKNLEQFGADRPDLYRDGTFRGAVELVAAYAEQFGGDDAMMRAGLTEELSKFAQGRLGHVNTQTSALIAKNEQGLLDARAATTITGILDAVQQGNAGMADYHMMQFGQALNKSVGMNDVGKLQSLQNFQATLAKAFYEQQVAVGNGAAVLNVLMGKAPSDALPKLPDLAYVQPEHLPPEKRLALVKEVTAMMDSQQAKADKAGKLAGEQTEFQVRVKAHDPTNPLTSTQTIDLVTPLIGKGLTADAGMKLVQEVRDIEQKVGPDNIREYNLLKDTIEADPFAVSRRELINSDLLNGRRTRELLALKGRKEADRAKADYYTNQPA